MFWIIQNVVLSWKVKQFEEKKRNVLRDLSILNKFAASGPYRHGHFFSWFFWLIFWNVENTLPILSETFKMLFFHEDIISLKQKQHVLWTFQFWQKLLYPDLTSVAIFLVDFLKCWKYPSNCSETFKMLFIPENKQFEEKTACVADFSNFDQNRCIRDLSGVAIFLVDFLKCWKYPSNCSETFKMLFFHENKQFEGKKSNFWGPFNFDQNHCIRKLAARPFYWDEFFWLIFWNVENTLRILRKHSKLCSFMKTLSLKKKKAIFGNLQFWPNSLYPDLTSVAIFLFDFLKCGKCPYNSSEKFKILFFHQNN